MLERFEPRNHLYQPIKRFRDDFTQLMNRFFEEPFFQPSTSFIPAINVKEETERYIVEAEVPGMDINDIDIEVNGNLLTIRGERRHEEKDKQAHVIESSYGAFKRSFTLPENVKFDEITAESKQGILFIYIPKDQTQQARKIEIRGTEH